MRALERMFKTLIEQLRGFSLTAKMLIGALMVILTLSLVLVAQFAGRAELVPLGLSGPGNGDARVRAASWLQANRIAYEDRGDDLYVPADQGSAARGALLEDGAISTDQLDFSSLFENSSPFLPNEDRKTRYLLASMAEIERMISSWSVVERAKVQISKTDAVAGFGKSLVPTTATATIFMGSGSVPPRIAESVAAAVSGAHADLRIENVRVIDGRTGSQAQVPSGEDAFASRFLLHTQETEAYITRKIANFLEPQIPGVRIAVMAEVNTARSTSRTHDYLEPKNAVVNEGTLERSATNTRRTQEAGVRPNTTLQITPAGSVISETAENRTDTSFASKFGQTETVEENPGGQIMLMNAVIGIPSSYIDTLYASRYPEEAEAPDPARRQALETEIEEKYSRLIRPLLVAGEDGSQPGAIEIATFADGLALISGGRVGVADGTLASSGAALPFVGEGIVRTGGLALLSLVSLGLMFMMVRRASRQEEMPTAEELVGIPPALAEDDSDLVGEAEEAVAALEGMEVDEGDMRRNQMLEQINDLARQSPDETASLVRKWISAHE